MGATTFMYEVKAMSAKEAYFNDVETALAEFGNDGYNGTVSTTQGFTEVQLENVTLEKAEAFAMEVFNGKHQQYGISKWHNAGLIEIGQEDVEVYVPFGFTEEISSSNKGTKKWITKYFIYKKDLNTKQSPVSSYDSLVEAKKYAKLKTKTTGESHEIVVEKVLENQSAILASYSPKFKTEKRKGGLRTYLIFGIAAE